MDHTPAKENGEETGSQEAAAPKGINWRTIFGLIFVALLIVLVFWLYGVWQVAKEIPLIQNVSRLQPAIDAMLDMTQAQIENQGQFAYAVDLGKDPTGYADTLMVVEGTVGMDETMSVSENIAGNIFSDTVYKGFVIDQAVVVIDITGEAPDLKDGTTIRGFGRLLVVRMEDIWALPIIGPDLEREFGGVDGLADSVVFLISKGIQVLDIPSDDKPPTPIEGKEPPGEEGEAPASDDENPCNPCEENPCGENPCNPCEE
ncbi:hypothetical protein IIA79_03470 [bacterium]|nr:hypothetical protein [bacterium]